MRFVFADCSLDTDRHELVRSGAPVPVEPQVFDLLHLLAENAGNLVTKDALVDAVWDGRIVSDATISARINAARKAVGDDGSAQTVIRTVPRRGFTLIAPTTREAARMAAEPETDRQTVRYTTSRDGTMIAWATSGSGPPLLRAGHHLTHLELDWNGPFWRPHFDALGEDHTLVRFDIRGTGLSEANLAGTTIEHHVDDLAAVVEAAGLDRFPMLVANQSTPVALHYIARNPGRVTRLVIHNGYARGRALRGDGDPEAVDPFFALLKTGAWGDPTNGFMRAWISAAAPSMSADEATQMIETFAAASTPESVVANRTIIDRFDARDVIGAVDVPTLIVHARNCTLHPLAEGRLLAASIKGAEFLVVDSADTICVPSDPTWGAQTRAIREFLAEG